MNETPPPTSITEGIEPLAALAQIGIDLVSNVATTVLDAFAPAFSLVAQTAADE